MKTECDLLIMEIRSLLYSIRHHEVDMDFTVFFTVLSGVSIFVIGQLIVKLVLDPVHDLKKIIGQISHTLIERANIIANPGVPTREVMDETSNLLRKLSSQLHAHLYLIPTYDVTCRIFRLPSKEMLLAASTHLVGLSNSVYSADHNVYKTNARRVEAICDSLGIYIAEESRYPKEIK
ncbi:hypothetical protein [Nitrosomonas ureae]|uniref:Uncharacterized protein n=1 Tax=Nitrosomonas ureae TaxID=44577 RepID=A0A286ABA6_9PROT|nr:hypothetical protein [Nitrosomonas ureae]SOD19186.1 hypothetical protein SAMN06297164_2159 [Nitrosomonas ureae]